MNVCGVVSSLSGSLAAVGSKQHARKQARVVLSRLLTHTHANTHTHTPPCSRRVTPWSADMELGEVLYSTGGSERLCDCVTACVEC